MENEHSIEKKQDESDIESNSEIEILDDEEEENQIENNLSDEEDDTLDLNQEIEIIEDDDIDLPPLVPMYPQLPHYNSINGFFIPIDEHGNVILQDQNVQNNQNMQGQNIQNLQEHLNDELWGTNYIQFHFPLLSTEILDALLIAGNSHIEANGNVVYSTFHENKVMKRVKDALVRCKNVEDPLILEVPNGTKDSILQLDDFKTDDEAYVLDDCFNNFYLYETLDQMFKIQNTDLNPFSQTPIQRIMKVKLVVI
jgi:hypothetical protein